MSCVNEGATITVYLAFEAHILCCDAGEIAFCLFLVYVCGCFLETVVLSKVDFLDKANFTLKKLSKRTLLPTNLMQLPFKETARNHRHKRILMSAFVILSYFKIWKMSAVYLTFLSFVSLLPLPLLYRYAPSELNALRGYAPCPCNWLMILRMGLRTFESLGTKMLSLKNILHVALADCQVLLPS